MGTRIDLGEYFARVVGLGKNVYFQPPSNIQMSYPAIVYHLATIDSEHANNRPYVWRRRYTVTLIDKNPESEYVDKILAIPTCAFDRFYVSDNLNHWVFVIYSKEVNG